MPSIYKGILLRGRRGETGRNGPGRIGPGIGPGPRGEGNDVHGSGSSWVGREMDHRYGWGHYEHPPGSGETGGAVSRGTGPCCRARASCRPPGTGPSCRARAPCRLPESWGKGGMPWTQPGKSRHRAQQAVIRCHFDERSEEKSCVPPERGGKISRCARNDRGGAK